MQVLSTKSPAAPPATVTLPMACWRKARFLFDSPISKGSFHFLEALRRALSEPELPSTLSLTLSLGSPDGGFAIAGWSTRFLRIKLISD